MKEIIGHYTPDMKLADLHLHTSRYLVPKTDGSGNKILVPHAKMSPQQLVDAAVTYGRLHTIAITEHNMIAPAYEAREYADKEGLPIQVIVGSEISTRDGHLGALNIHNDIPRGLSVEETIIAIHTQGGLAIAVHPFFHLARGTSLHQDAIEHIMTTPHPLVYLDGIEVHNAGVADWGDKTQGNQRALAFYKKHKAKQIGAPLGGSDGHFYLIGRAMTAYHGDNVCSAIRNGETSVLILDQDEQATLRVTAEKLFGDDVYDETRQIHKHILEQLEGK